MAKQHTFKAKSGNEYLFQHPGIRYSEEMKDESKDQNGKFMPHRYYQKIMENVIVKPGVDYAYFDELEGDKEQTLKPFDTEFTLVYPGAKTLSEMAYQFMDGRGQPSIVKTKEGLMKHIIKIDGKPVSFDYFDETGNIEEYNDVTDEASTFYQNTEFQEVMSAARRFLGGEEV